MSAAGSLEQSAKRVVSKCGLMGLSAAVFLSKRQRNPTKWLRCENSICINQARIPKEWMEWKSSRDDFWDAMQWALITRPKPPKTKGHD